MKLCLLLLAHFIGDFMLQSAELATEKKEDKKSFLLHCLIYLITSSAVVALFGSFWQIVLCGLSISISHCVIDAVKIQLQKRRERAFWDFIIDQTLHIIILIAAASLMPEKNRIGQAASDFYDRFFTLNPFTVTVLATAYAACLHPAGVFVKKVFLQLGFQKPDNAKENTAGFLIGILERCCILTLAILSQYTAISFVIAAKSLARIKLLEEKDFAEKYLIGTLISLLIALVGGVIVQYLIGLLPQ